MKLWIDEGELLIGDSLVDRIAEAIHETNFVVALVSSNSVESNWCRKEISWAINRGIKNRNIKVLPVRIGRIEMPPSLSDALYLDLNPADTPEQYEQLVDALKRRIESRQSTANVDLTVAMPAQRVIDALGIEA
jgi:ribosome-binding factor A